MLAMGIVQQVERLLADGKLSQRKIAQAVGVSRGTISAIAAGKRPAYASRLLDCVGESDPRGPIERCPTCGGRAYMPCRLCRVRKVQAKEEAMLKELRRRAREQSVKRLLFAILRAAVSDAARDTSPEPTPTSAEPIT